MSRNNQGQRRRPAAPQTIDQATGSAQSDASASNGMAPSAAQETSDAQAGQSPATAAPAPAGVSASEAPTRRTRRRKKRAPLGEEQLKMSAPERLGFHRHWVNDTPGRLENKYDDDYDYVMTDEGEKTRQLVGVQESGEPLYAYLMEKPEEWYREDQHAKDEPLRQFDKALKRGIINGPGPKEDAEAFYAPEEQISVTTKNTPTFRP